MAAFAKPLLYAGTVDLVECSIGIQNLFLFFFKGGKFKNKINESNKRRLYVWFRPNG